MKNAVGKQDFLNSKPLGEVVVKRQKKGVLVSKKIENISSEFLSNTNIP